MAKRRQVYEDEIQELRIALTRDSEKRLKQEQEKEVLTLKREELLQTKQSKTNDVKQLEKEVAQLEDEKRTRMLLMKYVDAPEEEWDQKVLLLARFDGKIKELEQQKEEYHERWKKLKNEYYKLRQGKVMELPAEVKTFFEEEGIQYIYGMEWLKNNGKTARKNQQLVEKNPFIPFSIIVDTSAVERLKEAKQEVYTTFPIPIVLREELEMSYSMRGGYLEMGTVNFFIAFNRNLLDEAALQRMLQESKQQQEEIEEKIDRKQGEITTYVDYRHTLSQQSVSKKGIASLQEEVRKKQQEEQQLVQLIQENKRRDGELKELLKELINTIGQRKELLSHRERKEKEFQELVVAYETYCEQRIRIIRLEEENKKARKQLQEAAEKEEQLRIQLQQIRDAQRDCKHALQEVKKSVAYYVQYKDSSVQLEQFNIPLHVAEEEYKVLTQGIQEELKSLQERLNTASKRFHKKEEDLQRKNQYDFVEKDYEAIIISDIVMKQLQEEVKQAQQEEDRANEINNRLTEQIAILMKEIQNQRERLLEKTGTDILVEQKAIVDTEFEERLQMVMYQINKKEKELRYVSQQKKMFSDACSVMEEYRDFTIVKECEVISLEEIEERELRLYHGTLRKELRDSKEEREQKEKACNTCIRNIAAKVEYQEEYFQKSFRNLCAVIGQAALLREQLEINCQAYESTMKKLQVDLDIIEKERASVEESFLEYIKCLDDNMRLIDKNSTITLRGRSLKMLKINVPDWESNEALYRIRLRDFIERFIQRGLETVDSNKNVDDVLGNIITTKNLYNDIVGINNIGIKMYKIETEREVLITWSEVSANSGGEGFLSAFVILSCLLSYMRRDDSDLFSNGNEGKVLIMDNPFAQTYSAHLLKPLMDIAKKTNTQLICLSGLGGEDIYNRFDNIYVIKLVSSNLKKGLQYMNPQHIKGDEIKRLKAAQFKIEQRSLFEIE